MFKVSLPINVMRCRETKEFVVHTPALDVSSCGKTESQALRMFGEAVQLFLSELERMGTIDDVLTELGWTKVERPNIHWVPPELLHQKKYPVKVPACA
jgi:hypothetical protein